MTTDITRRPPLRTEVRVYGDEEGRTLMDLQRQSIKARLEAVRMERLKGDLDEYREMYGADPEYRVEREHRVRLCKRDSIAYASEFGRDSVWRLYHTWSARLALATSNPDAYIAEFGKDVVYLEAIDRRAKKRAKRQI